MSARAAVAALLLMASGSGQVCRISVAGLNRNRKVMGPIHAECPGTIHTAPFGNWGVTSNFGQIRDDHQFQGWCHDSRVCDNQGSCWMDCLDGWYEWNSCTDNSRFAAPNCTLYNDADCRAQMSPMGINVHGTRVTDVGVRCPVDTNQDGIADQGGCADAAVYRSGTNFMSLYELDPGTGNDLIQTLYFPEVVMQLGCDQWGCAPQGSNWLSPIAYDSPKSPAKVYAEMVALVNSAVFIDTGGRCRAVAPISAVVSAASYQAPVAPDSIATLLGRGLASATGSAASATLPQELAGTRVAITDATGTARTASLLYVSLDQVNLLIPAATAEGEAAVSVTRADGVTATASVQVGAVAPALFSANANGTGVAAATALRVAASGARSAVDVFRCDGGVCVPAPIDFGTPGDRVFVSLYGTGLRRAPGELTATAGGVAAPVLYAGPQSQYPGLDQVNIELPAQLRGRGLIEIVLNQRGHQSNPVLITVQ